MGLLLRFQRGDSSLIVGVAQIIPSLSKSRFLIIIYQLHAFAI